ncbi:ATP-binding cassette domain-containing protein [Microbacterium atlanticum]|uniref:ATP-binding cassette domain-containing protein n=1 Tax=Microbacterium atlanticum TaxID=2782168 RepID=UPI001886C9E8|nr:ABC transporter ATP-binding protein [Microbacterium atlanticum]
MIDDFETRSPGGVQAPAPLVVQNLQVSTTTGIPIVHGVTFAVNAGEVFSIVGESGSGKTAVAHALLGHARPGLRIAGGRAIVAGTDVVAATPARLQSLRGGSISYVPQDAATSLFPRARAGAQLRETMIVHGIEPAEADRRARELTTRVGLPDRVHRAYPFQMSGGQQQRLLIAMAMATRPSVVVLDEPTTGLDVTTQARVLELIGDLARSERVAFVYISHDLAVVEQISDRIAVMRSGRIVEEGRTAELVARPAHPYTAMLLRAVPRVRADTLGQASELPPPASETDVPLLRVSELELRYGASAPVVKGVDFDVRSGECVALVGESGSGKSTTGRAIAGLMPVAAGCIELAGERLADDADKRTRADRERIQLIFQNPDRSLNPSHTVEQILGRPLRLFGIARRAQVPAMSAELLDRVHLSRTALGKRPHELSGGEKQRVAIARALAARPQLLVCDEVTSALDVSVQASIVTLLSELRAQGLAMLFITHNLGVVRALADRVLVMRSGEVCERGTTRQVLDHPAHEYTAALLAAAPDLSVPQEG